MTLREKEVEEKRGKEKDKDKEKAVDSNIIKMIDTELKAINLTVSSNAHESKLKELIEYFKKKVDLLGMIEGQNNKLKAKI